MAEHHVTDAVRDYFESAKWKYRYDEENGTFGMLVQTGCEEMDACMLRTVIRKEERFTTFVTLPFRVPEKKRTLAAGYISRVNYQLLLGCFELDFRDGEIQYKTTCFCGNVRLDREQIRRQIEVGIQMAEQYGSGLIDLLFKGVPKEEVFETVDRIRKERGSP